MVSRYKINLAAISPTELAYFPQEIMELYIKYTNGQLIDDENRVTLASASSKNYKGNNIEVAKLVGEKIAEEAKKLNINKVVFDRGGYLYHGKVQALADAARSKGLEF